ncbi:MAG TPA: ArsR family transcriptional regulator [Euryarchaeota archaeon]|nr:bacterial regulatory protein, arsR family [archaeon BMS3Bbin15]HDL15608.1 ArsR family transcriptional regulator [Euryarchaeota archaeon]
MATIEDLFSVMKSSTRRDILKLLMKEDMHISGIARAMKISVPQASKHIKILEEKNLVEKKIFGRTHVLRAKTENIYKILDGFSEEYRIEVEEGTSVLEALKQVAGVRVESLGERNFVISVDGEDGYYIYEVNGKLPDISMDKFRLKEDTVVDLKKIVHAKKKRMDIKVIQK